MDAKILWIVLGVLAAVIHAWGYLLYAKRATKGQANPNKASFMIWTGMTWVNVVTFGYMSNHWSVALQALAGAIFCTRTLVVIWSRGEFKQLQYWYEYAALAFCVAATTIGLAKAVIWSDPTSGATWANIINLLAVLVSMYPAYQAILRNPHKEGYAPWCVWSAGFVVNFTCATLSTDLAWHNWPKFAYPVIGFVIHFIVVAILIPLGRRRTA